MKSRDATIVKYRAALNTAKSNKEYAAILTELNTTKADNTKVETQALELMKNIETDESQNRELEAEIEEHKEKLNNLRREADTKAVEFEKEIEQIQKQWDEVAAAVDEESLTTFKRVAETYDGEALATVEAQDVKNAIYTCGGCFMGLTAETANMLMTKDEVIRCPNCTRILVMASSEI